MSNTYLTIDIWGADNLKTCYKTTDGEGFCPTIDHAQLLPRPDLDNETWTLELRVGRFFSLVYNGLTRWGMLGGN